MSIFDGFGKITTFCSFILHFEGIGYPVYWAYFASAFNAKMYPNLKIPYMAKRHDAAIPPINSCILSSQPPKTCGRNPANFPFLKILNS